MPDTLKKAGALAQRKVTSGKGLVKKTNNPAPVWEAIPAAKVVNPAPAVATSQKSEEGENLYEILAKYCAVEAHEAINFNDGTRRKIVCYFIDKATMSPESIFYFSYGKEVLSFNLTQSVSTFGTSASIEVNDINGSLTSIIEAQSNFYFVVGIYEVLDDSENEDGFMLEPYVFEIEDSFPISADGASSKVYRIDLIDLISATLKKVSFGNLLLQYPAFPNCSTFVEAYQYLMDFAALIINLNHNKRFFIDSELHFSELSNGDLSEIFQNVVMNNVPLSMTCYELLDIIYKHAAHEIETPSTFMGEQVGNVLAPLMLQNEFEDINGMYRSFYNVAQTDALITDVEFPTTGNNSKTRKMVKRGLYCKDLLMPFELAFDGKGVQSQIYENINPAVDEEGNLHMSEGAFAASNGVVFSPLVDPVDIPPSNFLVGLGWKNLALLAETPSGSTNMLVYWNWIYEFYKSAFLNEKESVLSKKLGKNISPNIDPHFHVMESAKLTGGDAETFAKINANTIVLSSSNPLQEALYHVGRSIKSYIFMNAMFGFRIKGSIFRHPGEIIKINSAAKSAEEESTTAVVGGLEAMANSFVLAYTTSITHNFNGSNYENLVYANKICSLSTSEDTAH